MNIDGVRSYLGIQARAKSESSAQERSDPSIPKPASLPSKKHFWNNGEFSSSYCLEGIIVSTEVVGFARQISMIVQIAAPCMAAAIAVPAAFLFTGLASFSNALIWTVPQTKKSLDKAKGELELKMLLKLPKKMVEEAKEAVEIEKLSFANQILKVGMGLGQMSVATFSICSNSVAKFFAYSPVLVGQTARIAIATAGAALGVIYLMRGSVMIYRSMKCRHRIAEFHAEFKAALAKSPQDAVSFLQAERDRLKHAFGRFSLAKEDREAFPELAKMELSDEEKELLQRFESLSPEEKNKMKISDPRIAKCFSKESALGIAYLTRRMGGEVAKKIFSHDFEITERFLVEVDEALYTEQFKQRVLTVVGGSMIAGGILSVTAACFSGGMSMTVISLVSAIFFVSVEGIFFTYDCGAVSKALSKYFYARSEKPKNLDLCIEKSSKPPSEPAQLSRLKRGCMPHKIEFFTQCQQKNGC